MNLDEAQKKTVAGWIAEGLKLSEIQKRIGSDLGLNLSYMEVRLLVDDLKVVPKDTAPPPIPKLPESSPAKPGGAVPVQAPFPGSPLSATPAAGGLPGGSVAVSVDTVARAGAMVSGSVTFSDGQKAGWYMDQYGRLGVAPEQQGYKPSPADVQTFQAELEKELARSGL
jgi:hypothetical protein